MIKIKQGDAYDIQITLKDDTGAAITDAVVDTLEITLGQVVKKFPGDVTYSEGVFTFSLAQTETHGFSGILPFQARVKFIDGSVVGTSLGMAAISVSASKAVL